MYKGQVHGHGTPSKPNAALCDWPQDINNRTAPASGFCFRLAFTCVYIYKVLLTSENFPFGLDFLGVFYKRNEVKNISARILR